MEFVDQENELRAIPLEALPGRKGQLEVMPQYATITLARVSTRCGKGDIAASR